MKYLFIVCFIMNITHHSDAQNGLCDRPPYVAGQFYPARESDLLKYLEKELNQIILAPDTTRVRAIIVPHAGYMFSGNVAAHGFAALRERNEYKTVFLLGSSHVAAFEGACVFHGSSFSTPIGKVPIDTNITAQLKQNELFGFPQTHHDEDHCLEVELPFLQYTLKKGFNIVPITLGTKNSVKLDQIAAALKPYFNDDNLFVISTDLSHYPGYADAVRSDSTVIQSILSGDLDIYRQAVSGIEKSGINNHITALCGYSAVYVMLKLTGGSSGFEFQKLKYANSGDVSGDFSRVVGYTSIVIRQKPEVKSETPMTEMSFTADEQAIMFEIARGSIRAGMTNEPYELPDSLPAILREKCGVFVTLHLDGKLRGCIGTFRQDAELAGNIKDMARAAAFSDPRFSPVSTEEFDKIELEISVLTPMRKIDSTEQIVPGKNGIYIKNGSRSGTFLPQVATEQGWTTEEMLGHCSRDKAGLGWDGWKDAATEIYIYEAIVLKE